MAGMVRAAVLLKPKTLELARVPAPAIGADDALLRIEACGICGSDYEQYDGAQPPHEDYTPSRWCPATSRSGASRRSAPGREQRWGVTEGDRVAVRSGLWLRPLRRLRALGARACRTRGGTYGYTTSRSRRSSGAATRSTCISPRTPW